MSSKRAITLSYWRPMTHQDKDQWQVEAVNNSTEHNPGQYLDKAEVDRLCGSTSWDVKIISPKKGAA